MYKCKACNKPACVIDDHIHRTCKCTRKRVIPPITKWEKFLAFFGKKKYETIPSAVVMDMTAEVEGTSKCSL